MKHFMILILLLPMFAGAEEPGGDDMRLTVKPVLCITDKRNPSCDMSFLVTWQSGEIGYYCAFNSINESSARCWSDERAGQFVDDLNVRKNFSYWMTGSDPDNLLAEVTIEVLRIDSDDRRRKRRTRHVWDIN